MTCINKQRSKLFLMGFLACLSLGTQAGISVIVSAPPAPREIVVGPAGYTSCFTVQPGFYDGVWHHKHRVCEYGGAAGLRMWVSGYWQCGSYRDRGVCTRWHWIRSHWANRHDMVFYRRPAVHRHVSEERVVHTHGHGIAYGEPHGHSQVHGHH